MAGKLSSMGFSENWALGLGLYLDTLPDTVLQEVWYVVEHAASVADDDDRVFKLFKEVGGVYKWAGSLLSKNFHFFVNWELLGGYQEALSFEDTLSAAKEWLGNIEQPYGTEGEEDTWAAEYAAQCRAVCAELTNKKAKRKNLTLQEYLNHPAYRGSAGSSDPPAAELELASGKVVDSKKTKWANVLVTPTPNADDMVTGYRGRVIHVSVKREKGKARLVARIDNRTNDLEGYILHTMEDTMKNIASMPLTWSSAFGMKQRDAAAYALGSGWVGLPIDGEKFDHNVRKQANYRVMYRALMNALAKHATGRARTDLEVIAQVMDAAFDDGRGMVSVRRGRKRAMFPWTSGFDSGSRLTAALEQLLLLAHARTVRAMSAKLLQFDIPVMSEWGQGDDYTCLVPSVLHGVAYCELWTRAGYPVNVAKNFIGSSNTGGARTEFLRKLISPTGAVGYPARVVSSIMWRSPIVSEAKGTKGVRGALDLWAKAIGRGCDREKCATILVAELLRMTTMPKRVLLDCLATPIAYGGFGWHELFGLSSSVVAFKSEPATRDWRILSPLIGLAVENVTMATLPSGGSVIEKERSHFRDRIIPKQYVDKSVDEFKTYGRLVPPSPPRRPVNVIDVAAAFKLRSVMPYKLRPDKILAKQVPTLLPLLAQQWVEQRQWNNLEKLYARSFDPMHVLKNSDKTLYVDAILDRAPSYSCVSLMHDEMSVAAYAGWAAYLTRGPSAKWTYSAYRHWCYSTSALASVMLTKTPFVWGP